MDHEFTESQNKVIAGIETMARVSAACLFALGIFKAVNGFRTGSATGLVFLVFSCVLGLWLLRVGTAFDRIVKTQDNDMIHLTDAFRQVERIFRGIRNAQILLLVIIVIGFVVSAFSIASSTHH